MWVKAEADWRIGWDGIELDVVAVVDAVADAIVTVGALCVTRAFSIAVDTVRRTLRQSVGQSVSRSVEGIRKVGSFPL